MVNSGLMRSVSVDEVRAISELARVASKDAVAVATEVLADDVANARWRDQIGPCLTQTAAAALLGITPQAVAKRAGAFELLRLVNGDGRPAYPLFQFSGRRVVDGLGAVLRTLGQIDDDLTMAAWLTTPKRSLGGRTPVDALEEGDAAGVLGAAEDYLARSA